MIDEARKDYRQKMIALGEWKKDEKPGKDTAEKKTSAVEKSDTPGGNEKFSKSENENENKNENKNESEDFIMRSTYYDYRDVKVKIAHRLMKMDGWKVYGYHADNSDAMTDYFDPAYWEGIAEKNGFLLCVDVFKCENPKYYTVRTGTQEKADAETAKKIKKLEQMTQERGATAAEEATAKEKIEILRNKSAEVYGFTEEKEIIEPAHKANPPRCNWHIEKDGVIIDKGNGLLKFASVPDISGLGYSWEVEKWQKFNNQTAEEWKENYILGKVSRWGESERGRATKGAESAYNRAKKDYDLLEKFNLLIARFNNVCGGMVSNGSGEDGYIYEEIIKTEYKTELKPVEKGGELKEGQCFIVKTGFNYGHNKGYVYRIHKSHERADGTMTYIACRLGKGYKKERTGTSGRGNYWTIYDPEKFLKWFEKGSLSFCELEEVRTPYEVKKVVKKSIKAEEPKKAENQPKTESKKNTAAEKEADTPGAIENLGREPEISEKSFIIDADYIENLTKEKEKVDISKKETTTEEKPGEEPARDMFAELAKAYITGKQAPTKKKEKKEEKKTEPDKKKPPKEEKKPEKVGYGYKVFSSMFSVEELEKMERGEIVEIVGKYGSDCYFSVNHGEYKLVYRAYSAGSDAKYTGFIINHKFYNDKKAISAEIKKDINTELKKLIPDEEAARKNAGELEEYQKRTIDAHLKSDFLEQARGCFYEGKEPDLVLYAPYKDFSVQDTINYILNPAKFVENCAREYSDSYNRVEIYERYIQYNHTKGSLDKIKADKTRIEHKIKKIIDSISEKEKTVKIELSNGHSVKVEACGVRYMKNGGYISEYRVAACDRQYLEHDERGRAQDIKVDDIKQITHGQRVLYRAA